MDSLDATMRIREPADPAPDPMREPGMLPPSELLGRAQAFGLLRQLTRRSFLAGSVLGSLGLAACASNPETVALPLAEWREPPMPPRSPEPIAPEAVAAAPSEPAAPTTVEKPGTKPGTKPRTKPGTKPAAPEAALPWARPRLMWAGGAPISGLLNPMLPVTCVTIHHDGLEELIWSARTEAVAARLEHYRQGHLARGWADIGYHLVIDRSGTLWQGRSIRWQGAHVQFHNEGNIGVLVMGNFELQTPTSAQLATLRRVISDLRATYAIKRGRIYTHKEWEDAQTACPGRRLQPRVEQIRTALKA